MKRAVAVVAKTSGVYVLKLKNPGTFYVGTSEHIEARIDQHRLGHGSAWCRKNGGVLERIPTLDGRSEQDETLTQMLVHDFEAVRGFEFTGCGPLSAAELDMVRACIPTV